MRIKFFGLLLFAMLIAKAPTTTALELSLTVSGDVHEIKAVLNFIEQYNRDSAPAGGNPLKIDVHSMANGTDIALTAKPAPRPITLAPPNLRPKIITPGQPALITIAVFDERDEVDTLAFQVNGTNLSADLYDDGTHGDEAPNDDVWSVTLTPLETTPAGRYELNVKAFDRNGRALLTKNPEGEEQPLQVVTEITIER